MYPELNFEEREAEKIRIRYISENIRHKSCLFPKLEGQTGNPLLSEKKAILLRIRPNSTVTGLILKVKLKCKIC